MTQIGRFSIFSPLLVGVIFISLASNVYAQSFDCDKAGTQVEYAICGDRNLQQFDEQMGLLYFALRERIGLQLGEVEAERFINEQRAWIWRRNRCQSNRFCLQGMYAERLRMLSAIDFPAVAIEPKLNSIEKKPASKTIGGLQTPKTADTGPGWAELGAMSKKRTKKK